MMKKPNTVKVGDWIELEAHGGYCRWSKIVHVYQEDWISVVYLDDRTPVKDDMKLADGRWKFKQEGVSGFKINDGADMWRDTLISGPPHRIGSSAPWIEYLQPEDIVLQPRHSAETA